VFAAALVTACRASIAGHWAKVAALQARAAALAT
jgi:hypothetical protein